MLSTITAFTDRDLFICNSYVNRLAPTRVINAI